MSEEPNFNLAARRALFREKTVVIPGEGESAAKQPKRHSRVKVTINLDGDIVDAFKKQAKGKGRSYQMLLNDALREYLFGTAPEQIAKTTGEILLSDPSFIEALAQELKKQK